MTRRLRAKQPKRKVNPLFRGITRFPAPKLNFDGSNILATTYVGVPVLVAGAAGSFITVDCSSASGTTTGAGAANAVSAITSRYSQYRYNSCSVEFIPNIGPASADAGSRVHIAYIDGPEKMVLYATTPTLAAIRGCRNIKSFNVWERFTYRVPLTWRRKMFDVNSTLTGGTGVDEFERSSQGMILIFVESSNLTLANYGTFKVNSSIRMHELNASLLT